MSFQAMTIALAIDVPATQKSLLLCLANYVNEQNTFWPSYSTLAKDSGMCRRTVITHMNKFVEIGVVSKQMVMSEKGNQSNLYTFKGVQYLKKLGYTLEWTDTGYIKISPPQPSKLEGCKPITTLVQPDHYPSDPAAPNTISEPIKEPKETSSPDDEHVSLRSAHIDKEFLRLWFSWPNFKNRIRSIRAFKTVCKGKATKGITEQVDTLIIDVKARLKSQQLGFNNMMLSTYLNGERYNDDITNANNQSVSELDAGQKASDDKSRELFGTTHGRANT